VERTNGMILQGLKPRIFNILNKTGHKWLPELPAVVWSLRTTPSRATGFTPFFLVHCAEAILPTDLEYGSPRACLISWPCKAWLGSQALASHSPAKDGQVACLIGLAKLSQAEAFFVFDCSRQPGPRPTTKPGHCLIRSKPRRARATELHMRGRGEETSRGSSHNITNQHRL
jgi:hypothetical protein